MGLFDIFNRKKKDRERHLQQEAERIKKEEALKAYQAVLLGQDQDMAADYIAVAEDFGALVYKQEYNSLLECLDKIDLPEGRLNVEVVKPEVTRDKSCLMIALPDGRNDENIFNHLQVEQSCMGAWQANLLHTLWRVLPLFGHAIYDARDYLFVKEDMHMIKTLNEADRLSIIRNIVNIDFTPEVRESNGKFYISCCYWSNFFGLVREYSEIKIEKNRVIDIVPFDEKNEYRYDCGIRF